MNYPLKLRVGDMGHGASEDAKVISFNAVKEGIVMIEQTLAFLKSVIDGFNSLSTAEQFGITAAAAYTGTVGWNLYQIDKYSTLTQDVLTENVFNDSDESKALAARVIPSLGSKVLNAATFNYGGLKFLSLFGGNLSPLIRNRLINMSGQNEKDRQKIKDAKAAGKDSQVTQSIQKRIDRRQKEIRDILVKYKVNPILQITEDMKKDGFEVLKKEEYLLNYIRITALLSIGVGDVVKASEAYNVYVKAKTDKDKKEAFKALENMTSANQRAGYWWNYCKIFTRMYLAVESEKPIEIGNQKLTNKEFFTCDLVKNTLAVFDFEKEKRIDALLEAADKKAAGKDGSSWVLVGGTPVSNTGTNNIVP